MSCLLLSDLCLSLLLLLQFYSISLTAFLLVLLLPPFTAFFAAAAGLNALFTHVPRRAATLSRYYNLWNGTSVWNVVSEKIKLSGHRLSKLVTCTLSESESFSDGPD
jgi:hypothetical protein